MRRLRAVDALARAFMLAGRTVGHSVERRAHEQERSSAIPRPYCAKRIQRETPNVVNAHLEIRSTTIRPSSNERGRFATPLVPRVSRPRLTNPKVRTLCHRTLRTTTLPPPSTAPLVRLARACDLRAKISSDRRSAWGAARDALVFAERLDDSDGRTDANKRGRCVSGGRLDETPECPTAGSRCDGTTPSRVLTMLAFPLPSAEDLQARKGCPCALRPLRRPQGHRHPPVGRGNQGSSRSPAGAPWRLALTVAYVLQERPYPHAIVAGIERYPRKVTRGMGKKRIEKRSKVKPFIKVRTDSLCWRVRLGSGRISGRARARTRRERLFGRRVRVTRTPHVRRACMGLREHQLDELRCTVQAVPGGGARSARRRGPAGAQRPPNAGRTSLTTPSCLLSRSTTTTFSRPGTPSSLRASRDPSRPRPSRSPHTVRRPRSRSRRSWRSVTLPARTSTSYSVPLCLTGD